MKKKNLTKMALLGLAHGLLLNGQIVAAEEAQKLREMFSSNPQLFAELSLEGKALLSRLNHSDDSTTLLATGRSGSSCSTVAKGCGANKCSTVAAGCGANKCSTVAAGCGATKCSTVAAGCGANKCSSVADRDISKTNLQDPSKVNVKKDNYKEIDYNSENMNFHLMTEAELMLELNDEGIRLYKSLSPEGKKLALEVASQACNNTNQCKGLNACQTEKNACAGKGACKGQSKCAHSDKNVAVKLVVDKMAAKRNQALGR